MNPETGRLGDCLFDPLHGQMNTITTGMVIMSETREILNVTIGDNTHLNSESKGQPGVPYIVAWIVRLLPERDAFCPCSSRDPTRQVTPFCTIDWEVSS